MSIDARVDFVFTAEDGSGYLALVDRPKSPGRVSYAGNKGQPKLHFKTAPHEVTALNGLDVWGGAGSLMLGDREIAKRTGYAGIAFTDGFLAAVGAYHERRRTRSAD
jgi:hypothetical protein